MNIARQNRCGGQVSWHKQTAEPEGELHGSLRLCPVEVIVEGEHFGIFAFYPINDEC